MASLGPARFPLRFDPWFRVVSSALLLRSSDSFVEVAEEDVSIRMGWAFRADFPRSSVVALSRLESSPLSRGVHGFAGQWLVNGSGDRILVIDLAPTQRARVLGFPVRLGRVLVSMDDPDALAERLRPRAAAPRAGADA